MRIDNLYSQIILRMTINKLYNIRGIFKITRDLKLGQHEVYAVLNKGIEKGHIQIDREYVKQNTYWRIK